MVDVRIDGGGHGGFSEEIWWRALEWAAELGRPVEHVDRCGRGADSSLPTAPAEDVD